MHRLKPTKQIAQFLSLLVHLLSAPHRKQTRSCEHGPCDIRHLERNPSRILPLFVSTSKCLSNQHILTPDYDLFGGSQCPKIHQKDDVLYQVCQMDPFHTEYDRLSDRSYMTRKCVQWALSKMLLATFLCRQGSVCQIQAF